MSKPRNKWRPAIARHSHRTAQLPIATCPDCGKRAYTSKGSAKNSGPGPVPRAEDAGVQVRRVVAPDVAGRGEDCRDERQARGSRRA